MGKHPKHPQTSLELTTKPQAQAASTEAFPSDKFPLLPMACGTRKTTRWKGAKSSRVGRGAAFPTSQARVTQMIEAGSPH